MTERMTSKAYREAVAEPKKKPTKYNSKRTSYTSTQGFTYNYQSEREAQVATELDLLIAANEILSWTPQVTLRFQSEKHTVDFLAFCPGDHYRLIEAKGYDTPNGKRKRALVEKHYKIKVEVW